jgi:hypothetical protein
LKRFMNIQNSAGRFWWGEAIWKLVTENLVFWGNDINNRCL